MATLTVTPAAPAQRERRPYGVLHRHWESCKDKEFYATRAAAQYAYDHWRGWRDPALELYACTCCYGYHLGRYAAPKREGDEP